MDKPYVNIKIVDTLQESFGYAPDICDVLDQLNENVQNLSESEFEDYVEHLKLDLLDIDRFIKVNDCQPITNPVFYERNNIPTDDGFMSNKIFGITKDDRAGIFAYIDLHGWFIDPSCYKAWIRIDSNVKNVVHGLDTYSVNDKGDIVQDPKGSNGIEFLRKNINKIRFKSTESIKRDLKIQYLNRNKSKMFINKYPVIPPFYRDTNSGANTVGVGGVNVLYRNLLLAVVGLQSTQDYGFDNSPTLIGRVQETLLTIYDWFAGNNNPNMTVEPGMGISGKRGVMRSANMSKTTNYSSRMVISSPELKVDTVDDMMVNMDQSALPLAACLANFRPFILFEVKRFFENEFIGNEQYPVMEDGKVRYVTPVDPLIWFSDEKIKREMDRFLHGYNNRFVMIEFPVQEYKRLVRMTFKGKFAKKGDNPEAIYNRHLTWCDIFYQAACEVTKDKACLITRYPIDRYFNQTSTKIVVSSTKETEPMYVGDKYYPYYPKIREEDIGTNTGNSFVDTFKMSNLYLKGMAADYDGDTVTAKSPFTIEANEEAISQMSNKSHYINLGADNIRNVDTDTVQSVYSLTRILKSGKPVTDPVFS